MRKIVVVISARASYSRIKTALIEMKKNKLINLHIVLMASAVSDEYGNIQKQLSNDGLEVFRTIETLSNEDNHYGQVVTTARCLYALSGLFKQEKPDAVVTIADRHETIATAIASTYMNIPLVHIQGGEVSGNIDERVRHAITKLADVHFVCTKQSMERVIKMGENPQSVYELGCPSCDLAQNALDDKITAKECLQTLGINLPFCIDKNKYIVVLLHTVTDEYEKIKTQVTMVLEAITKLEIPVLWIGNNADAGSKIARKCVLEYIKDKSLDTITFIPHIPNEEFLVVLRDCKCIVGNSSVGIRECSYMGIPAINIGGRQSGRERGNNVIDTSFEIDSIIEAIESIEARNYIRCNLYGEGNAGKKISEKLATIPLKNKKRMMY